MCFMRHLYKQTRAWVPTQHRATLVLAPSSSYSCRLCLKLACPDFLFLVSWSVPSLFSCLWFLLLCSWFWFASFFWICLVLSSLYRVQSVPGACLRLALFTSSLFQLRLTLLNSFPPGSVPVLWPFSSRVAIFQSCDHILVLWPCSCTGYLFQSCDHIVVHVSVLWPHFGSITCHITVIMFLGKNNYHIWHELCSKKSKETSYNFNRGAAESCITAALKKTAL